MNEEPIILAIDPSQRYLGYAYRTVYNKVVRVGSIEQQTQNAVDWHLRACLMAAELSSTVERYYEQDGMRPVVVVMEVPDNWHTDRGNASKNSEAVQKLYFTSGAIIGMLVQLPFVKGIWTVLPKQWKGSTPKGVMVARFGRLLAAAGITVPSDVPDDSAEACLLGHQSYGKQMLDDDPGSVVFGSPYVNVYAEGQESRGTFSTEVYVEEEYQEGESEVEVDATICSEDTTESDS